MTLWNVTENIFDNGPRKSDSNLSRNGGLIMIVEIEGSFVRGRK